MTMPPPGPPLGAPPAPDYGAWFDLVVDRSGSLFRGAAVALFFGLAGVGTFLAGLAQGKPPPLGASIAVLVICTPLTLAGLLMLVVGIKVKRAGGDFLNVNPTGLARTSRGSQFEFDWREIARIDVIATQFFPGYNPIKPGNTRGRRTGEETALRITPIDPAGFAARHPTLDVTGAMEPIRRMVGGPFGLAFPMQEPLRSELAGAIAHYAGPRFGGRFDETARARYYRAAHPGQQGYGQPFTDGR